MTRTLTIGIASYEDMKARTLAIARGTRKRGRNEPKVWFTSLESLAKVLSAKNQALLELIAEEKPDSLAELEKLSGRAKSNLSRTLKTMERYGFVELSAEERRMVPRVLFDRLKFEIPLHVALPTTGADGRHGARKTPSE